MKPLTFGVIFACLLLGWGCDPGDESPALGFAPDPPAFEIAPLAVGADTDAHIRITNETADTVRLTAAGLEGLPADFAADYALYYTQTVAERVRPEGSPDAGSQMIIVEDGINRFEDPVLLAPGGFVFLIVNVRQSEGAPIAGQVYFETDGAVAGRFTAPIRSTGE